MAPTEVLAIVRPIHADEAQQGASTPAQYGAAERVSRRRLPQVTVRGNPQGEPSATRAAAQEPRSRADAPGGLPEGDRREAYLGAMHELSERLTAITNYLASGLRLSQIGGPGAAVSPRHSEVLEKALNQANRADEVIHRLQKLLVMESKMAGDREQAIRERAYALWEQDGHPHGRDLEHWLRAEAEISGDAGRYQR